MKRRRPWGKAASTLIVQNPTRASRPLLKRIDDKCVIRLLILHYTLVWPCHSEGGREGGRVGEEGGRKGGRETNSRMILSQALTFMQCSKLVSASTAALALVNAGMTKS